jgi:mRNA interferase MazF
MLRGEIYFVTLAGSMGSEQAGRRPVLIVSADDLNARPLTVVVVPGTDAANLQMDFPSTVRVSKKETGLSMDTVFLCHQIRSLDHRRFIDAATRRPVPVAGHLSPERMRDVEDALLGTLDIFLE